MQGHPRIFTIDMHTPRQTLADGDTNPQALRPQEYDITECELPQGQHTSGNPVVARYLREQPVILDFGSMSEGDWALLTMASFDETEKGGPTGLAYSTFKLTRELGQFTGKYIQTGSEAAETPAVAGEGSLEDVSFILEPYAAGMDANFGVCEGQAGELPRLRKGGFLLASMFLPDIGHTDHRWRFGPVVEAFALTDEALAAASQPAQDS